jgi:hypothetical protein
MGWIGLEPAERAPFTRVEPFSAFAMADDAAWQLHPEHQWIYDRLRLTQAQGLPCGPAGTRPRMSPYVIKPIINLSGLSQGCFVFHAYEQDQFDDWPGFFWMPYLPGDQFSIDVVMLRGRMRDLIATRCYPIGDGFGLFAGFEVDTLLPYGVEPTIQTFLEAHLPEYTGVVNVEVIGKALIEVHLRPTTQWATLYGRQWPMALARLVDQQVWDFDRDGIVGGWSVPVYDWLDEDGYANALKTADTEIQVTAAERIHPPGRLRTAVVNAQDRETALSVAHQIGHCEMPIEVASCR